MVGLMFGDKRWINMATKGYRQYMETSLRADGGSYDLEQHDALHAHISGLMPLLELALTMRQENADLLPYAAPSGASLQRSVEFVLPYARGQKVHPEWTNSKVAFDRQRWESGDAFYKPGKPWDPAESADLFSLSAFFVKEHAAVAAKLRGAKETERFSDWLSVLRAAEK
jgi:hypothetical protein